MSGSILSSMPSPEPRRNRGPAAAAENRAAILGAARELFAEQGFRVPMQAVARRAGVGQGVLYRHFPSRHELALAAFEQNFTELEDLTREPDETTFARLWDRLLEMLAESVALVELVVDSRRSEPHYDGAEHLVAVATEPLALAQRAGLAHPSLRPDDILLNLRMAYGIVVTSDQQRPVIERLREVFGAGPLPLQR